MIEKPIEQMFKFTERENEPLTLETAVHEAVGAASMAWTPTPTGVFDDAWATTVAQALVERIRRGDLT